MSTLLQPDDEDGVPITEGELRQALFRDSVVAFVDLKSVFDVANRDIILSQLVDFDIKGNLLQ
ncbi:hypothetical protein E2C01_021910 [Portunus trituberculatus]|uniref:Uncharacterized protein n=1 Tax=Portunus trituberculatus TaxID=210409 RepID=A0A5B7E410_PORTR|nr:hypothetical protein [Portunus trituberculatus]